MRSRILNSYPLPIAYRYGCLVRVQHDKAQLLDQILRCAEMTERYLAALAISSFAAREDPSVPVPPAIKAFTDNLCWGHFHNAVTAVLACKVNHPFRNGFSQCLGKKDRKVLDNLDKLIKMRNDLSHDINGFQRAADILDREHPGLLLQEVLSGIEPICASPLFRAVNLAPRKKLPYVRTYWLMGEQGNPIPEEYAVSEALLDDQVYIALPTGVLSLHPMLVWEPEGLQTSQGLHVIHRILQAKGRLEYTGIIDQVQPSRLPQMKDMTRLLTGEQILAETVTLVDGMTFHTKWHEMQAVPVPEWNEETFMKELEKRCGKTESLKAHKFIQWIRQSDASRLHWSDDDSFGAFGFGDDWGDEFERLAGSWLIVSASGQIECDVHDIEDRWHFPLTEEAQTRLEQVQAELYTRLNQIQGLSFTQEQVCNHQWSNLPLAQFQSTEGLVEFASALAWYYGECRNLIPNAAVTGVMGDF